MWGEMVEEMMEKGMEKEKQAEEAEIEGEVNVARQQEAWKPWMDRGAHRQTDRE